MHVWHKPIFKAYFACCNEGTKKGLENISMLQNKAEEANTKHLPSQRKLRWNKR